MKKVQKAKEAKKEQKWAIIRNRKVIFKDKHQITNDK